MSLKDCLKKMTKAGIPVSKDDQQTLQQYLDSGLTEDQAVDRLVVMSDKDIVDITLRAKKMGAAVANRPDFVAEIYELREKNLEEIRALRDEIQTEREALDDVYNEISFIENDIRSWPAGGGNININNVDELTTRIQAMWFSFNEAFRLGFIGDGILQGNTHVEVVESFLEMQQRKTLVRERMNELMAMDAALDLRINTIFSGETRNDVLDVTGSYLPTSPTPTGLRAPGAVYVGNVPWQITSRGEGQLYIQRHGKNAGTVHKERSGPNDFAISFDESVLLPEYAYYLLQYLQPQIAARARATAQQAIRKTDITEVLVDHFQNQVKEDQGDLFSGTDTDQTTLVQEAVGNYKVSVRTEERGSLPIGIQVINNAFDAAHVMAPIRRNAQEGMWALVTDEHGKVLSVIEHAKGGIDGTSVYPSIYAGAILTTPGAKKVWFSHNHPSGTVGPSQADERITKKVSHIMDGSGVEVMGHIILGAGSGTFSLMNAQGQEMGPRQKIKPAPRRKQVPITTRIIRRHKPGVKLTSPDDAKQLLNNMGNPDGVLLLTTKHEVLAFLAMTPEEQTILKNTGGSTKLLRAFSELNVAAAIVSSKDLHANAADNMQAFMNAGDVTMLDYIYVSSGQTRSLGEQGQLSHSETFFQSVQSPLGYTSGLLTAARVMPREKGTAAEMLAGLRKIKTYKDKKTGETKEQWTGAPGVTKQEYDWLEIELWAEAKGSFTRDELIAYIEAGGIQVDETLYAGVDRGDFIARWDPAHESAYTEAFDTIEDLEIATENGYRIYDVEDRNDQFDQIFRVHIDPDAGNVAVQVDESYIKDDGKIGTREKWLDVELPSNVTSNQNNLMLAANHAINDYVQGRRQIPGAKGPARWSEYVIPGQGLTNVQDDETLVHREIVLHMPEVGGYHYTMEDLEESHHPAANDPAMSAERKAAVEREIKLFHYIDAIGEFNEQEVRRVQTFQIKKSDFPTIEAAKQYIIDEKPVEPPAGVNFVSHAYPEKNIIVWFRVTDRVGPNGEKIFFVEEVQSELHQRGRETGYALTDKSPAVIAAKEEIGLAQEFEDAKYEFASPVIERMIDLVYTDETTALAEDDIRDPRNRLTLQDRATGERGSLRQEAHRDRMRELLLTEIATQSDWLRNWERDWAWQMALKDESGTLGDLDTNFNANFTSEELSDVEAWREAKNETLEQVDIWVDLKRSHGAVPDMPFKDSAWNELAMKRIIRLAVEGGYDQVAWTTGDQQNARWNLAEYYDAIEYNPRTNYLYTYDDRGNMLQSEYSTLADLNQYITTEQVLEITRQMDELRGHYDIVTTTDAGISEGDLFVGDIENAWIKNNGMAFVIVDENGEIVRQSGGDYHMAEYYEGAEDIRDDFAFGNNLPRLENVDLEVGGEGKRESYDEILVNVTRRALKKLDKKAKVKRFGVQMEGGISVVGQRIEREGGGNLVGGIVDPGAFYVTGWIDRVDPNHSDRKQISPRFDTYEEADAWQSNITMGFGNAQHGFDITPEIMVNAMEGQTLFQPKKGSITFNEARMGVMRMTSAADLSTFLHEAGHLYLEVMRSLAEEEGAGQQIKADWGIILKNLDVTEGREITREHHEKFANMFLLYTSEGKAPSLEMQDAFSAFRAWLMEIYANIKAQLGVKLNDEIRGVFDRMLASDEQIAQAEMVQGFAAIFSTAEDMGVTPEQFQAYRKEILRVHNEGVDKETRRLLKAQKRDQLVWWNDERKRVQEEVAAEAHAMREYIALSMLQRGKNPDGSTPRGQAFKLDKASIVAQYGKEWLKRLPGAGKSAVYRVKGGTNVDVAAGMFGFKDGKALMLALIQTPKMAEFIKAETAERMDRLYPDPMKDGTLAANAINTVHSEGRAKIMAIELRALKRKLREAQPAVTAEKRARVRQRKEAEAEFKVTRDNLAEIKAAAKLMVRERQIRAVSPNTYLVAERKAGRLAFNAATKGKFQEAYEQKRQQLVNHEMYRAALQARKDVVSAQKYLKKFESKKTQARMGKRGVLKSILAVIEGIDFRNISLKQVDRNAALQQLAEDIHSGAMVVDPDTYTDLYTIRLDKNGNEIVVLNQDWGTNWQDLTVGQFLGMRDIVKQIVRGSEIETEMMVNDEKLVVADVIEEFVESLMTNNKQIDLGQGELTGGQKFKKGVKSLVYGGLSPGTMARILDNGHWGVLTRYLIVPIRRAYVEKLIPRLHKATEDVANLYLRHYTNSELATFMDKEPVAGHREDLSKAEILTIALHWGSEGNRAALLGGVRKDPYGNETPAYTEQGVKAILAKLASKDWAFVQDVWHYLNTYWPEVQAAERRRRGVAPEKVEASPFTMMASDGVEVSLEGGYMRLYYDRRHGKTTKADEVDDYYRMLGNGVFVSANTRAGSTHNRVKNHGRVVRLGLGAIDQHLSETIRDISLGDEIIFAKRLLNDEAIRSAFMHTDNEQALDALTLWLTDATVGEMPAQDMWQKGAGYLRVGFVKSKLAFSATVTLLQFTGFFQSMALVGKAPMMRGLGQLLRRPSEQYKYVMETSSFMQTRYGVMQTFNVDVSDTQSFLKSIFGPVPTKFKSRFEAIGHYYFWTIAKAQSVVDVNTFLAAKWKAENMEGLSGREAILYADNLVEGAQTSGIFSDRTALERGTLGSRTRQSQFVRLWVTLIGYMLRKAGLSYEATHRFQQEKTIGTAVTLAMDFILLFVIEGIASQLIYGNPPEDEDDDGLDIGDIASWTAAATADSVVSGIPLVRETATARYGSGNTAVGSVATDMFKFMLQVEQLEADEAAIKMGVKVFGTLFHLPASQTNRAIEAYMSDDPEWYEYIMGVREE